ncbi:hypothetical protein [uncultured Sphingomonas sp.]
MSDQDSATSDAEVIKLAEAERDAGVPDMQTAEAAAAAKRRLDESQDDPS